ncbi:MAG: alpha/beta fold hydrolase [Sphingomonas sp.]
MKIVLRIALSALAPLAIIHPHIARGAVPATAAAAPAASAEERLGHISVTTLGTHGPAVILIPGLASPRAVWDGIAPELAKTHRVYLVQVNGFGGDDPGKNLEGPLLTGIVADLDSYIASHKLTGATVIGHSMGGLVSMMLAKAHPGAASKLMIVDSLPFFAVLVAPPGVAVTPAMVAPQAAIMRDRTAAAYGKPADPAAISAQTRGLALKPSSIAKMEAWAAKADPRVTAQGLYDDLTTDMRASLPALTLPITVVIPWHAGGPYTKEQTNAFYARQYDGAPKVRFVLVEDAAHFVMLDQPEAFASAVKSFLAP